MLFRIPIAYYVDIIRPKCRNSETVLCGEWIEVDVPEVSDLEAPVALRWMAGARRRRSSSHAGESLHETRWMNGSHYEPSLDYSDEDEERDRYHSAPQVADNIAQGRFYGMPLVSGHDWQLAKFVHGETKPLSEIPVRTVVSAHERDLAIADAHERAAKSLIIDGQFWEQRGEPAYSVSQSGGFSRYVYVELIGVGEIGADGHKANPRNCFRVDRYEDALDQARALGADQETIDQIPKIDVLIPESVRYNDEVPALMAGAREMLGWGKDRLGEQTREVVMSWLDLRDAIHAAEADASEDNLRRLEIAIHTHAETSLDGWYKDRSDSVLERWRMRPMTDTAEATYGG